MKPTSWAGWFVASAILAGLMVIIYRVSLVGLADVSSKTPVYDFNQWRSGQSVPEQGKLVAMQTALSEAYTLDPDNPNLLEMLGRLDAEMAAHGTYVGARTLRLQSLAWFGQALRRRPTSGHAWLNVALMKYQLGQIDAEFSLALQQAQYRGPWDTQVQLGVIELGLAGWPVLPESTRATTRQAIRTQGQWRRVNQRSALLALIVRYKRSELACLLDPMMRACPVF